MVAAGFMPACHRICTCLRLYAGIKPAATCLILNMLDDHKFSLRRIVSYRHPDPGQPEIVYGPGGPERTYGRITDIYRVHGRNARWEYTVTNSFTGESCRVRESYIHHGADQGYLDLYRRESIPWLAGPPELARNDSENGYWRQTLKQFVRAAIPKIIEKERDEESERIHGRNLNLGPGDYFRVRGDLRPEIPPWHNLYAKVLSVRPSDIESMCIPKGRQGIAAGKHRVVLRYSVLLDSGEDVDVYDVEIKTVYTKHSRGVVLNWRAAAFLAEAFGDDPPYDIQLEYLQGHVFTRAELQEMKPADLAELLARLLYAKGILVLDEFPRKAESLLNSRLEYLVDQILDVSRFDMHTNRPRSASEIARIQSEDTRLKGMLE
jgi:hypothetical protein